MGLGWEVYQVSSTLNLFFPLDSVFLMLHALGLEALLTASGLKDFDCFTFLFMTLFT